MHNLKKRLKILFVYGTFSPFVKRDFEVLDKHFAVTKIECGLGIQKLNPLILFKIARGVKNSHITYSWFAGFVSALTVTFAKILSRRSIVVVGGAEVISLPEIRYGFLQSPFLKILTKYVLNQADHLLPVSDFLKGKTLQILSSELHKKVKLIYNGIDPANYKPNFKKEPYVITACYLSKKNLIRKGILTFFDCARNMPEVSFVLIYIRVDNTINKLINQSPKNLRFIENPPTSELIEWYQKATVYCQLSRMETFGVALAEAMLCECIPVTTGEGALMEVAGNTGFIVPFGDSEKTICAIKKAFLKKNGASARKHIMKKFNLQQREQKIKKLINNCITTD